VELSGNNEEIILHFIKQFFPCGKLRNNRISIHRRSFT